MIDRPILPGTATLCAGLFAGALGLQPAFAATHEQIIETCKQSLFAQIHACVVGKLGGLPRNAPTDALEKARQQCGPPLVRPCVMRESKSKRAAKRPQSAKERGRCHAHGASPVQPAFVAPPRTIADITAILDSEKPDAAKDAQRKAEAEAAPPANANARKLAQFYYDRGNARALLAQNKDALGRRPAGSDLSTDPAATIGQLVRIRQFVALQYRASAIRKTPLRCSIRPSRDAEPNRAGAAR